MLHEDVISKVVLYGKFDCNSSLIIFLPMDTCSLQESFQIGRFFRGEILGIVRTNF